MRFGVQAVSHLAESQVVAVPEVLTEFVTRARAFVPIGGNTRWVPPLLLNLVFRKRGVHGSRL